MNRYDAATLLKFYYAATVVFLLLDFVADINVRLAFLADRPEARIAWYLFCLGCSALMLSRPAWTEIIGAFESLLTLVALLVGVWMRALLSADAEAGADVLTFQQIINFLLAGGVAYIAWFRGITELYRRTSGK